MALLPPQKVGVKSALLRDALVALSLANLLLLSQWIKSLDSAVNYSHDDALPAPVISFDVLIVAALLFCGARLARRSGGWLLELARISFLLLLLVPVNVLRLRLGAVSGESSNHVLPLFAPLAALAIALFLLAFSRFKRELLALGTKVTLLFSPFVLVTFGQAAWQWRKEGRPSAANTAGILPAAQKRRQRVVWIVFDELDQRATFLLRPSSVALPELDDLRARSWHAENAYPPNRLTMMAIPSLLTGKIVCSLDPTAGASGPSLKMAGEFKGVPVSETATVFKRARELGFRVGVVGWYHPYCRSFAADVERCEDARTLVAKHLGLWGQMKHALASDEMIASLPLGYRLLNRRKTKARRIPYGPELHLLIYQEVMQEAKSLIVDRNVDLAFVHFPIPHLPEIFDRRTGEATASGEGSYFDNLALVDRTVGELRRVLENAGLWDETSLLLMSDHWWRIDAYDFFFKGDLRAEERPFASLPLDARVPFLLKLAGAGGGRSYDKPFNTVLAHDLVLALLRDELRHPEDVDRWFDEKASAQAKDPFFYLYVCK